MIIIYVIVCVIAVCAVAYLIYCIYKAHNLEDIVRQNFQRFVDEGCNYPDRDLYSLRDDLRLLVSINKERIAHFKAKAKTANYEERELYLEIVDEYTADLEDFDDMLAQVDKRIARNEYFRTQN